MDSNFNMEFRKASINDNLEEIAELLYRTDPYIYPYWFGSLDNCKKELSVLLKEKKFFFNVNNLYIAIDRKNKKIVGVVCVVDKGIDLSYDYSKLESINDRYKYTIENYVKGLIQEVEQSDFVYISNVCVHPDYRGKHIGSLMMKQIIQVYKNQYVNEIVLDVLADNPGAIKLYQNMGFEQIGEIFEGFNGPDLKKPDVFSMKAKLKRQKDTVVEE